MSFYRFEKLTSNYLTPHLSTGRGPVIEGDYCYFCLVRKEAGTGSELHYHPNELLIFPIKGKLNVLVAGTRRIVEPGMFVHVPPYVQHSVKATEEGNAEYLYMKDKTWTVVGLAADEAVPDKAMTVTEVNALYRPGAPRKVDNDDKQSSALRQNHALSFYRLYDAPDAEMLSGRKVTWVEGHHLAFGLFEIPGGGQLTASASTSPRLDQGLFDTPAYSGDEIAPSPHEAFIYVLAGHVTVEVSGKKQSMVQRDIAHVRRHASYRLTAADDTNARFVVVCSTPRLERRIDTMTTEEAEQARLNVRAD